MTAPQDNRAELMTAYLDAELDREQAEAFERHLAESPEARQELEDLRKVVQLVGSLGAVEAPPDFYDNLARKLRRRRLLQPDAMLLGLVSLPFQVLSIIVILTVAALYTMAQLEQVPQAVERDPAAPAGDEPVEGGGPQDAEGRPSIRP